MKSFTIATRRREDLVDMTAQVASALEESGVREGACLVYVPHTTCGVTINENADPDVRADILAHLARLVPRSPEFRHTEGNSDAHIKASLLGSSVLVPISAGRMALGTWQAIFLGEFDGPRSRRVHVQALPATEPRA